MERLYDGPPATIFLWAKIRYRNLNATAVRPMTHLSPCEVSTIGLFYTRCKYDLAMLDEARFARSKGYNPPFYVRRNEGWW
jgi:hypothetical protein